MDEGLDELRVPLKWTSPEGVEVTKTLIFRRGSYRIDVEYAVKNASGTAMVGGALCADPARPAAAEALLLQRGQLLVHRSCAVWHAAPSTRSSRSPSKEDASRSNRSASPMAGWLRCSITSWSPWCRPCDETHQFTLRVRGDQYVASDVGPPKTVAAGAHGASSSRHCSSVRNCSVQLEPIHRGARAAPPTSAS